MLGYYNYTVILTYIGMLFSFVGTGFAALGRFTAALICLMVSGLCDMFDGKIASTMERTVPEKQFGIQIDSLSDLICFGALPGFLLVMRGGAAIVPFVIGGLYVLATLIRLAYFNVDELQRQSETTQRRKFYRGLPVTSSALLIPLASGCDALFGTGVVITCCLMVLMAAAFLTPFKLKKPDLPGLILFVALGLCDLVLVLRGGI